jgi:hypothetical protein
LDSNLFVVSASARPSATSGGTGNNDGGDGAACMEQHDEQPRKSDAIAITRGIRLVNFNP